MAGLVAGVSEETRRGRGKVLEVVKEGHDPTDLAGEQCPAPRRSKPWLAGLLATIVFALLLCLLTAGCGENPVGDAGPVSQAMRPAELDSGALGAEDQSSEDLASDDLGAGNRQPLTSEQPLSGSSVPSTRDDGTVSLKIYLVRDEKLSPVLRQVAKTKAVGTAALRALVEGPTAAEAALGLSSCLPPETTLLGLRVEEGIAHVDLSREFATGGGSFSMRMRLAQVVFTLTQFATVEEVRLYLDGKAVPVLGGEGVPVDRGLVRADFEDMCPAILVEAPVMGATVRPPLRITGSANVFEGVFRVELRTSDGRVLGQEQVRASAGTGTRGLFDVTINFPVQRGTEATLVLFARSPKEGTKTDIVEIPLRLLP